MAKLSLKHIYKVYEGGVRAVNDFDLEIKDKEFIVFVGPSGCGKSTTLRMVAGLESITAGQLYIDDTMVNETDSKDRDIAMVFQSYALYPHMTVYQNMAFGLKLRKLPKEDIDRRVKEAAEILEISDLLSRKPKALSGGQRQRVALGRAIVREPKVFLLDEPLSNLDAKLRVQMRTEITKLHKKLATTFIYVTHDQTEAMTMGDRIVVMKKGYVQQVDTPLNLYENPANLFVATFLGSPQMNIFKVNLDGDFTSLKAYIDDNKDLELSFSRNKSKQLINKSYIGKSITFGIRPEHIEVCEKGGISCIVDVTEQLGDQTIIYAKIKSTEVPLVIKSNNTKQYSPQSEIFVEFMLDQAHLFDSDNECSILSMPLENSFEASLKGNDLIVGENIINLPKDFTNRILDEAREKSEIRLVFAPKDVYLEQDENYQKPSICFDCVVDFVEEKSNRKNVFTYIKGVQQYLSFPVDSSSSIKALDKIKVYIDIDKITLKNEYGTRLVAIDEVKNNVIEVTSRFKDNKTILTFGKNRLVYDGLKLEDGIHHIKISQDRVRVLYNKKVRKDLKLENPESYDPKNTIKVSSYDEDLLGKKNAIFVSTSGVEDYLTFVVDNCFSVYRMPKFDLLVPKEAITIID